MLALGLNMDIIYIYLHIHTYLYIHLHTHCPSTRVVHLTIGASGVLTIAGKVRTSYLEGLSVCHPYLVLGIT